MTVGRCQRSLEGLVPPLSERRKTEDLVSYSYVFFAAFEVRKKRGLAVCVARVSRPLDTET